MSPDTNVDGLLATELERRLDVLSDPNSELTEARAALHSIRGSAAVAGHADLALVVASFSQRLRQGDREAAVHAAKLFREAAVRLRDGQPPFPSRWPEPPPGLAPSPIDPKYRAEYLTGVQEHLRALEEIVTGDLPDAEAHLKAERAVHAIKGSAASVGDDATVWYCHGLETFLRAEGHARSRELTRHRAALVLLIEDQAAALDVLRGFAPAPARRPSTTLRRQSVPPESETTGTLRVEGDSLDRLIERLERMQLARDEVGAAAEVQRSVAAELRELRVKLHDALRAIGPPRPWGPPAAALGRVEQVAHALAKAADETERGSLVCKQSAETLRGNITQIRREMAKVRRTTLSSLLEKLARSVERLVARDGRNVRVIVNAVDAPVDREVAERLVDPLMQLARNALAHGIESEDERIAAGKTAIGTIRLTGERNGDWLRVTCEDDGRGVDIESMQKLARRPLEDDEELLSLLFLPGLTTKASADFLAGRGVGLDLALSVVRRLGGTLRLARGRPSGITATIEVPSERWMIEVLWVKAGDHDLALPLGFTGRVARVDPERPPVHLATCIGLPAPGPPALSLELSLSGVPTVSIGVDAVGAVEECGVRPVPSLVSAAGPFSGAILRGDGALHLLLDATLLAVKAWAVS